MRRQRSTLAPNLFEVIHRLFEPNGSARHPLDSFNDLIESRGLRKAGEFGRQVVLQRHTGGLCSFDEFPVDLFWHISDQDVRHACIMQAQLPLRNMKRSGNRADHTARWESIQAITSSMTSGPLGSLNTSWRSSG